MSEPGQMSLLDWTPPRARNSDPLTSHEAADHAAKFSARHYRLILEAMRWTARPMAPEEVADAVGWTNQITAGRRMTELEQAGILQALDDNRYTNRSGRKARRYVVTQ